METHRTGYILRDCPKCKELREVKVEFRSETFASLPSHYRNFTCRTCYHEWQEWGWS